MVTEFLQDVFVSLEKFNVFFMRGRVAVVCICRLV